MVSCTCSMLDSRSRGLGSIPGWVIVLSSWARHFTLTVPLSTLEHKWVLVNCQGNLKKFWGVTCDGLASHPGGVAVLLVTACYTNWDKLQQKWATRLVRLNHIKTISIIQNKGALLGYSLRVVAGEQCKVAGELL